VDVAGLAVAVGLHVTTARFHLGVLERAGRLWAENEVPADDNLSWDEGTRRVGDLFERLGFAPRLAGLRPFVEPKLCITDVPVPPGSGWCPPSPSHSAGAAKVPQAPLNSAPLFRAGLCRRTARQVHTELHAAFPLSADHSARRCGPPPSTTLSPVRRASSPRFKPTASRTRSAAHLLGEARPPVRHHPASPAVHPRLEKRTGVL